MIKIKQIIYTDINGTLYIIDPAPKERLELVLGSLTDEEYEAHVWERSVPKDAINPQYADSLPEDWYFRDAWKQNGKTGIVDMGKAKEIHMDKIRKARDKKLKELDVETMKGIDVQDKKQVLRDLPDNFDLTANTPEELKVLWPKELL